MKKELLLKTLPDEESLDKIIEDYLTKSINSSGNIIKIKREFFNIINKIAEHNWINGYTSAILDQKQNDKFNKLHN